MAPQHIGGGETASYGSMAYQRQREKHQRRIASVAMAWRGNISDISVKRQPSWHQHRNVALLTV